MDLLVVGGTRFSGWFTVQRALARGHRVTLVHRGQSLQQGGFEDAEHLVGDRADPAVLSALEGRSFDAVLDFCGQLPAHLRALLATLGEVVGLRRRVAARPRRDLPRRRARRRRGRRDHR